MRHAAISISNSCCFNHYLFLRMKARLRNLIPAFIAALVVIIIVHNNARLNPKHYLLRIALVHPKFSPWRRLLNYGVEGPFLDLTGFNFDGATAFKRVQTQGENPYKRVRFNEFANRNTNNYDSIHRYDTRKQNATTQVTF